MSREIGRSGGREIGYQKFCIALTPSRRLSLSRSSALTPSRKLSLSRPHALTPLR